MNERGDEKLYLSILVPMHNEEAVVDTFFNAVVPILEKIADRYEILCINDGSRDRTLELLIRAHIDNPKIKIVDLSRNFGKEIALTAGLDHCEGNAIIPIDADLQDPPELIPDLVSKWREGYDMVNAVRSDRQSDTLIKRLTANLFYRFSGWLCETPIPANAGDFRLLDRKVVEALKLFPERTRFMKGLFGWLGFNQTTIEFVRPARVAGKSSWRYWKLWNFALEGIFSFTTLPLRIWTYFGFAVAMFALAYTTVVVVRTLLFGVEVPGYASLIVVVLFFSGINLIGLGVVGEYLGRVFIEVKRRPLYLVRETVGCNRTAATPIGPVSGNFESSAMQ